MGPTNAESSSCYHVKEAVLATVSHSDVWKGLKEIAQKRRSLRTAHFSQLMLKFSVLC